MLHNLNQDSSNSRRANAPQSEPLTPDAPSKSAPNHTADSFDIDIQACSTTDCTGLIPALPRDEFERESYEELYPYTTMKGSEQKR